MPEAPAFKSPDELPRPNSMSNTFSSPASSGNVGSSAEPASPQRRRSDARNRGMSLDAFLQDDARSYRPPIAAWQDGNARFTERIATDYSLPQSSYTLPFPGFSSSAAAYQYPYATSISLSKSCGALAASHVYNRDPLSLFTDNLTSYVEPSIDTEYGKVVQDVQLLEPEARPQISTTPVYECTFNFLGCRFWTTDEADWRLHNLSHFHGNAPPRSVTCPLCDWGFDGADGGAAWEARMNHLAAHIRTGATLATSRPDFKLFRFLWQKRIIDDAEYKELNSRGFLSSPRRDPEDRPASLSTEGPRYEERRRRIPRYPRPRNSGSPSVRVTPPSDRPVAVQETAPFAARIFEGTTAAIEEEVHNRTTPEPSACVVLGTEFLQFMSEELQEVGDLLEVIVVTGTEDRAFAAPCVSYAEKLWPELGACLLRSLVAALKSLRNFPQRSLLMKDISLGRSLHAHEIFSGPNNVEMYFAVQGIHKELLEFVEVLTWLSAVCRIPVPDKLLYSQVNRPDPSRRYFDIRPRPLKISSATGGSGCCWHDMFKGYVLAEGFPIPDRASQRGVELPFDLMTLLGLVLYPVNFGNGIILKGENTALIPSICEDDEDCVQWHYLEGDGANGSLSWDRIKEHCGNIYPTKDFKMLQSKRTFVGYFPSSTIHLGTRDSDFDKVDFSGAEFDDKTAFVLGNELVGQVGTSVMNFFTAQVSGKLMVHRTAHQRLRGIHDSMLDKVRNSKNLPILLFDVTAKQGWLVPELSALLHMALAWASYQHEPDQVLSNMPFADARPDGGEAAYNAILQSANRLLPDHIRVGDVDAKQISVLQALAPFFARIGQIKDQQLQRYACGLKENKDLVGYEFKEIASFEEHLHLRRSKIDVEKSGGWLHLVSRKPEMAVILCSHLKAPIRPASNQLVCHVWQTVPTDKYYLTASISSLMQLAKRCGGEENLRLYNDLYCIPSKKDPGPGVCDKKKWPCCNPLLELSKHPSKRALHFDDEGALIIGKAVAQTEDHSSLRVFLRSLSPGKDGKVQNGNSPVNQPLNGILNIHPPQPTVSGRMP